MYRETLAERLREVWTWYSSFTSLQGLTQYLASKSIQWKQYWFVISIAFSVPTITGVYNVFEDYISYPVVTNIQNVQNSTIDFPSVTICNTNRVHCGNLLKYISTCQNVSTYLLPSNCNLTVLHSYFLICLEDSNLGGQ